MTPINQTSSVATSYSINQSNTDDFSDSCFEGPEKLLELWFASSANQLPHVNGQEGLKCVPRPMWEEMLDLVQCKVLSVINSSDVDAYLLSESSMFVYPHKIILKTCGTTTLLAGLERLLAIAVQYAGFTEGFKPWRVFYSRKNFMFPDRQVAPHTSWKDEIGYLDRYFENGSAYQIGPMNGDHWYLYMYSQEQNQVLATRHHTGAEAFEDETFEILMTDLDQNKAQQFCKDRLKRDAHVCQDDPRSKDANGSEGHTLGSLAAENSGLAQFCLRTSDAILDSFLFDPMGFSANMVSQTSYATIHITPEPECSYASFETNMRGVVGELPQILDIFAPGSFTMTRFATQQELQTRELAIPGYKRYDLINYEFDGYFLEFQNWRRLAVS